MTIKINKELKAHYRLLFLGSALVISSLLRAQDTAVFSFETYYQQVIKFHPIAKQAMLLPAMAREEIRSARGAFDPTISADFSSKRTNSVQSYAYFEPKIKVPTYIGADIKGGLDQSDGILINPEQGKYDPLTGGTKNVQYQLFYAGVSVPVLRGLMTDARRNQLQQAQLLKGLNEADQVSQINKLLWAAAKTYWDWHLSYVQLNYTSENYRLAMQRKQYIVSRILGGEEKPIDSIEAQMECKRRESLLVEATLTFKNNALELSNYLWDENGQSLQLSEFVVPSAKGSEPFELSSDSLQVLLQSAAEMHPELNKLNVKLSQTTLEKKLAKENLKPQLNIEYYPFQTYTAGSKDEVAGLFMKNYKLGFTFYSSVFLRKERGKLALTNLKLQQNSFLLQQGKKEIQTQVLNAYQQLNANKQLLAIQEELVQNTNWMRQAEMTRFESGEGSLFLVNQRERALLEAQLKLAETRAKYAKAKYQLQFAAGKRFF